jgi:hypothetical protein
MLKQPHAQARQVIAQQPHPQSRHMVAQQPQPQARHEMSPSWQKQSECSSGNMIEQKGLTPPVLLMSLTS